MKRKNIAIIILMTMFFIIFGTKVYATTGIINADAVKLRKDINSKTVLDLLDKGTEVEILEQENGWYKVKAKTELGKVTGYISEEFIDSEKNINEKISNNEQTTIEEPVEEITNTTIDNEKTTTVETPIKDNQENEEIVLEKEITIKAVPLINSIEIGKISGNVKIIEIINDWSRIESDNKIGWIRNNTLKQIATNNETQIIENSTETSTEVSAETVKEEPQATEPETEKLTTTTEKEEKTIKKTGYVSAEGLRVREEASTDSKEIDSLSKNDKVEIIGQTGNWYKINLDGKTGYVSSKYISDTKLPDTTSRSGISLKDSNSTLEKSETQTEEENKSTTELDEKTTGSEIVEYAKKYLGYKYVSGGTTPTTGFDCSGFTSYVYKNFGISLNRTSSGQMSNGKAVEKNELELGDIVVFNNDSNTAIGHVGIYVGNGNFIHASNPKDGIKITTLETGYYAKRYVGARRVI